MDPFHHDITISYVLCEGRIDPPDSIITGIGYMDGLKRESTVPEFDLRVESGNFSNGFQIIEWQAVIPAGSISYSKTNDLNL